MKVIYKGHKIDVHRAESMGCGKLLYFSIFRLKDGYECLSSFTTGSDTVRDYVQYMKERIDAELADEDPWGEKASKEEMCLGYMQGRGAA